MALTILRTNYVKQQTLALSLHVFSSSTNVRLREQDEPATSADLTSEAGNSLQLPRIFFLANRHKRNKLANQDVGSK